MENPTPSLLEQGIQALREGKLDEAMDLLGRAVVSNPQDAEAQAFLGVSYSQKGLHAPATRALETATSLRPDSARYQFNLGVALEQAGDTAGAVNAYRAALQLDPHHAQARARAQALAARTATPTPIPAAPTASGVPLSAAPAPASASQAPWLRGHETPPMAAASLASPTGGPPGTVQCPHCHQWSKPGLSCEWCSAALRPSPAAAPPPSGITGPTPVSAGPARPDPGAFCEDSFNPVQGLIDWVRVLFTPRVFFQEQEGCNGMRAPLALLLVYVAVYGLMYAAVTMRLFRSLAGGAGGVAAIGLIIGLPLAALFAALLMSLWAAIVHGICKLLGGRAGYGGSFRLATYAAAPACAAAVLTLCLSASHLSGGTYLSSGTYPGSIRSMMLISSIGFLYSAVLLGIGAAYIHRLGAGQGIGVALVPAVIAAIPLGLVLLGMRAILPLGSGPTATRAGVSPYSGAAARPLLGAWRGPTGTMVFLPGGGYLETNPRFPRPLTGRWSERKGVLLTQYDPMPGVGRVVNLDRWRVSRDGRALTIRVVAVNGQHLGSRSRALLFQRP